MLRPTLLTAACLLLAGCAGTNPDATNDGLGDLDFGDVQATDTTGLIRGVAIDEAIRPLAGVLVNITGTPHSKTTGDDGSFAFAGLEPGTYFLQASKSGFETIQSSVDVLAGVDEPRIVKIQLVADPSTAPRATTYRLEGFIECSVRPMVMGQQCGFSSSDVVHAEWDLEGVPELIQSEMLWASTQAAGDELSLAIRCLPNADPAEKCQDGQRTVVRAEGHSPQVARINATHAAEWALASGGNPVTIDLFAFGRSDLDVYDEETVDGAQEPVTGNPCLYWPAYFPAGTCLRATGPGVIVNQKVDVFTTAFYGFLPPEDWTFINDGAPQPPQP